MISDLNDLYEELLTPEQYIKLNVTELRNIESSQIIPPELGEKNFGKIKVRYRSPIYKNPL